MPHSINVFFLFILMFTLPLPVLHTVYSLYSVLLTLHTVQYVTVHHASPFRPANPVTFSHLPSSSPTSQKNLLPASLLFSLSLSLFSLSLLFHNLILSFFHFAHVETPALLKIRFHFGCFLRSASSKLVWPVQKEISIL